MSKICTKCGVELPYSEFTINRGKKAHSSGLKSECKKCSQRRQLRYAKKCIEEIEKLGEEGLAKKKKVCIKCGIKKPLSEYHKRYGGKYGVRTYCKECRRKMSLAANNPPQIEGTKTCSRCSEIKPMTEFAIRKQSPDGRSSECKQCKCDYDAVRRLKKPIQELKRIQSIGKCEICDSTENLAIDHNHETGELRGYLCGKCNSALGLLKDDPDILLRAVEYLQRVGTYSKKTSN